MAEKYYITTPIYYPSGKWHLGTCYTTVICDALARFRRMQGKEVFYLTGTDEHGQKISEVANAEGKPVKEYINRVVGELKSLWETLDISYDKFIRTTDDYHQKAVQQIFQTLYDKGDIYKNQYEGWYCTPCESFWTEKQLVDGKCPDCGREVKLMKEESYFFRLSKYQDRIIELIENNPDFLQPTPRQNEMLNNFLRVGLQDLSVSRTSFDWGVKVPFDTKHVVYVWLDALTNYITALGYGSQDDTLFKKFWPAELHMMGKEIVRFHSIIWPAILMALDLPLPKQVYGHGWLLMNDDKMSKSKGNVQDPFVLSDRYGVDAVRYFLLREIPFGQDGNFTNRTFLNRINADLANDLGNLVSRTTAMITQYFEGKIPAAGEFTDVDEQLITSCNQLLAKVENCLDKLNAPDALSEIFALIQRANKYIDETKPWILAKGDDKSRLATVMYCLAEAIRFSAVLLQPFLTQCPASIFKKLGINDDSLKGIDSLQFGKLNAGLTVDKGEALFKRYDVEKELLLMQQLAEGTTAQPQVSSDKKEEKKAENTVDINQINIDDFAKIELKVGKILHCEKVENSDKLLCSQVDVGEESPRTVVSGIAKWYTAEQMVGKQVILVANLKPAKLRGIVSQGMLLCAEKGDDLCLLAPEKEMAVGSEIR